MFVQCEYRFFNTRKSKNCGIKHNIISLISYVLGSTEPGSISKEPYSIVLTIFDNIYLTLELFLRVVSVIWPMT